MGKVTSSLSKNVKSVLEGYLCLELGGKCVPCVYRKERSPSIKEKLFGYRFGGKGTPDEIMGLVKETAVKAGFDLKSATIDEIRKFMRRKRIGVDCSGFVYNLLKAFAEDKGIDDLDNKLVRTPSWNPLSFLRRTAYQINADYLTRAENSVPIRVVKNIQPADMVRMEDGKHVLIMLANTGRRLIYAHSSHQHTKGKGVHLGEIKVLKKDLGLDVQQWKEQTNDGRNFGKVWFDPKKGDGAFRLKLLV